MVPSDVDKGRLPDQEGTIVYLHLKRGACLPFIQFLCSLKQQDMSDMEHVIYPESKNSFYDSVVCYITSMSKYLIKSNTDDLS